MRCRSQMYVPLDKAEQEPPARRHNLSFPVETDHPRVVQIQVNNVRYTRSSVLREGIEPSRLQRAAGFEAAASAVSPPQHDSRGQGSRTLMPLKGLRILSPLRLPFRHTPVVRKRGVEPLRH